MIIPADGGSDVVGGPGGGGEIFSPPPEHHCPNIYYDSSDLGSASKGRVPAGSVGSTYMVEIGGPVIGGCEVNGKGGRGRGEEGRGGRGRLYYIIKRRGKCRN